MNQPPRNPKRSLEDLKRSLENAKPVVVDSSGRLSTPEDVAARDAALSEKERAAQVRVKPSRWF